MGCPCWAPSSSDARPADAGRLFLPAPRGAEDALRVIASPPSSSEAPERIRTSVPGFEARCSNPLSYGGKVGRQPRGLPAPGAPVRLDQEAVDPLPVGLGGERCPL